MVLLKGIPFPVTRRAVIGYDMPSFEPYDRNKESLR
jgi:hypothetical protein